MTPNEIAQLSEQEKIRRLQKLIPLEPYVDTLIEEARYKQARGTIISKWHRLVIAIAALVIALGVLWSFAQSFIKAAVR